MTDNTFHTRKQKRTAHYNSYEKGWIIQTCVACNGSGYYDADGNPFCGSCLGTGQERVKPDYASSATDIESSIGETFTLSENTLAKHPSLLSVDVYVRKRREVIYRLETIQSGKAIRIRTKLYFDYHPERKTMDWYFEDKYGRTFFMSDFQKVSASARKKQKPFR